MDSIFNSKILIMPPYEDCPKCGKRDSFGLLSIYERNYKKGCKECWYEEGYPLPDLDKKIIYIDQFAISNMMKSINPRIQITDKNDEFFQKLFLKLEYLAKAHIIVCPDSTIHYDESIMSKRYEYEDIKATYKYLSFETSYMPISTINRFHYVAAFKKYVTSEGEIGIDRETVCPGYNKWRERILIDVDKKTREDDRKYIKEEKEETLLALQPVFDNWKIQKPFVFNDIFKNELAAPSRFYINRYLDFTKELIKANMGVENNIDKFIFDETIGLVEEMLHYLVRNGSKYDLVEDLNKIQGFLKSDELVEIPNHRIECLMWAALARKAAAGQKNIKSVSIVNDIRAISSYMPYSDAIFIDKECHGLLNDVDVLKRLQCNTRVFSLSNKEEFIKYLDDMILKVPEEHIALLKRVYGEQWMEPRTSMCKLLGQYSVPFPD